MICPKCGSECRSKMTGAICLNSNCNWNTHDVNNIKIIHNELTNSKIGKQFKEIEVQNLMDEYDNYSPFDGL